MKNIGLDVKLLKIGLQYAQLRATGGNFLQLFSSQDNVKLEVDPSNYQNLTYLHAMVIDHDIVYIYLISCNMAIPVVEFSMEGYKVRKVFD